MRPSTEDNSDIDLSLIHIWAELKEIIKNFVEGYEGGFIPFNRGSLPVVSGISVEINETEDGYTSVSYTHLYQEMLLEFVSAESIKTEDVIDILQTGMYQIDRIEPVSYTHLDVHKRQDTYWQL